MKDKKAICILGGMGPEASIYLCRLLVEYSIKYFNAKRNDQFPEIIMNFVPVPDFISNDKDRDKALDMLKDRVKKLNRMQVSSICIACNTAHILIGELEKHSNSRFISMIEEVSSLVAKEKKKIVGLLGTPSTIKYGLYQSALGKYRIDVISPDESQQRVLEKIIRNILKGKNSYSDRKNLLLIADSLKRKGAEGIILGCTELPLVFPKKYSLPIYNSLELLSLALLRNYYK